MNKISVVGLDLAKDVFQVHGVDADGEVLVCKSLKRVQVRQFFARLEPCLIGLEACGGAHYWSRELTRLGHTVRMMAPAFVKPYLKSNKNDRNDAAAICEAVQRPSRWRLDHGTWSVLLHVYPEADIPIVQLSIDATKPAAFHFETGRRLAPLRDEGILIVGSGNLVHNLRTYAWNRQPQEPYEWAVRFEAAARTLLLAGDFGPLVDYETLGPDAALSIPTPDHYLPLLYVLGAGQPGEAVRFPVEGIEGGSISMLAVQVG